MKPERMSGRARRLVARATLLAACLAATSGARAAETLTVGKGGQNAFSFTIVDVGIREGIFAKHGLEVKSAEFSGGSRTQQALASALF